MMNDVNDVNDINNNKNNSIYYYTYWNKNDNIVMIKIIKILINYGELQSLKERVLMHSNATSMDCVCFSMLVTVNLIPSV